MKPTTLLLPIIIAINCIIPISSISSTASTISIALVESLAFNPSKIPAAKAITFLIEPQISTPITSVDSRNLIYLFAKAFFASSRVFFFLLARVNPLAS